MTSPDPDRFRLIAVVRELRKLAVEAQQEFAMDLMRSISNEISGPLLEALTRRDPAAAKEVYLDLSRRQAVALAVYRALSEDSSWTCVDVYDLTPSCVQEEFLVDLENRLKAVMPAEGVLP